MKRVLLLTALVMLVTACGFHVRGASSIRLPPELGVMRVTMSGKGYQPLLIEVRASLLEQGKVKLVDDVTESVPVLHLHAEINNSQVLAVDSSGRVSAYLLDYRVDFSLDGADGKPLLKRQPVKIQREYVFNRLKVLATEKQSEYLRNEMRRDAARQILRRLASLNLSASENGNADQP